MFKTKTLPIMILIIASITSFLAGYQFHAHQQETKAKAFFGGNSKASMTSSSQAFFDIGAPTPKAEK